MSSLLEDPLKNQNPVPQGNQEEDYEDFFSNFDISTLLVVASKSLVLIFFVISSSIFGAFIFGRYTKPIYEATSTIKLDLNTSTNKLGLVDPRTAGDIHDNSFKMSTLSGEIELLKSHLIYEKVLKQIDLNVSYVAYGKVITEEKYIHSPIKLDYLIRDNTWYDKKFDLLIINDKEFILEYEDKGNTVSQLYRFGDRIIKPEFEFVFRTTEFLQNSYYNTKFYVVVNSKESLISTLVTNSIVEILNLDANTIRIAYRDNNKYKAADIVNAIDSVYIQQTVESKSKMQEQTLRFLENSIDKTGKQLDSAESRIEDFLKKNKTINIEHNFDRTSSRLNEISASRDELKHRLDLISDLYKLIVTEEDITEFIPFIQELNDKQIEEAVNRYNDAVNDRKRMGLTHSDNTLAAQIRDKNIKTYKEDLVKLLNLNKNFYFDQLKQLNKEVLAIESSLSDFPEKETEYNRLFRHYELYEKFYLLMMEKEVEFAIQKAGTIPNFDILSPSFVPNEPIYPKKGLLYLIASAVGIFLSLIIIIIRYILHDSISNQKELEKVLKAPILGGIPEYNKEEMEFSKLVVDKSPKSIISEAIRSIRTNLEFISASQKRKKIITVTSTISGEGKTFVSTNLAGIIALSDLKVVVLDLDMRKPKVHLAFDRENIKGMSTILINKHTYKDCVQKTSIENLDFISAGPTPPNPSELILRDEMDNLLTDLHKEYDIIMIDSPPVGLVTDGILIMRKADIALYVVRANYSKKGVKKHINNVIRMGNFRHLAVIMNAVKAINTYGYGGYGYGYGYGYGNGYYEADQNKKSRFSFFTKLFKKD